MSSLSVACSVFITQTNIYSRFTPRWCFLSCTTSNAATYSQVRSGIIAKAQTRAPKYLSWRMTARSEWTYFLEALGRVAWFMTWRNHTGLVEMSPPLASIYTASTAGIHHLHITTPPRLVGDRTSGFVQSLTDSPSQNNKAYLRFREGRCWKCQHCFYRAEQQTTQSLLSTWRIFVSIPYPTNFCSELSSFNMSDTPCGFPFAFNWFLDFWSCVF